jgi:hypothetical protein
MAKINGVSQLASASQLAIVMALKVAANGYQLINGKWRMSMAKANGENGNESINVMAKSISKMYQ